MFDVSSCHSLCDMKCEHALGVGCKNLHPQTSRVRQLLALNRNSEGFLDDFNLIYLTDFGGRAAKRPVLDLKIIAGTAAVSRGRSSGDTSHCGPHG